MSVEAKNLDLDLKDGCYMSGFKNGSPRFVMPPPQSGITPRTKGQVSEVAVHQLMVLRTVASIMRHRAASR